MPTPVVRPANLQVPFANNGAKNTIPVASQITITPGAASYTDGFPPLTMTPLTIGGIPPRGQDLNGVLYPITQHIVFINAGGAYQFDAALSTAIGGYPVGAVLQNNAGTASYVNSLANNTTDFNATPSSIGVSWMPWAGSAVVTGNYYDVQGGAAGVLVASQLLMETISVRTITFPANFAGSKAYSGVATTSATSIALSTWVSPYTTGTSIGTISFSAGANIGTFTSASGLAVTIPSGQVIKAIASSSPDAAFASPTFTLLGSAI